MKSTFLYKSFLSLTFLLVTFPILTFGTRSVVTIVWSFIGIFFFFKENTSKIKLKKEIWLILIPYFFLIISLINSINFTEGLQYLIKMLSFVIIPIPFFLNRNIFGNQILHRIFYVFSFSIVLFVFYHIIVVFLNQDFLLQKLTDLEIKNNGFTSIREISEEVISKIKLRRFRNYVITISNTHTTYQGLWISFAVLFFCIEFYKKKKKPIRIILFFLILVLIGWLLLISTRMPLFSLLISSIITIVIFGKIPKKKLIYIGLLGLIICSVIFSFKNPVSIRVKEYYKTGLNVLNVNSKKYEYNSSNVRNGIYYCSLKLVKNNFIFGVGIGDVQDELNNCYSDNISSNIYTWRDYNTHNQYLFFFVTSGVFGFLFFLLFLYYLINKSYKQKNFIYFYFIISVSLMFLTENILERSDGVIFFSFFNSIFLFNNFKRRVYL
ncbi:O-antigen ligase family protein [Polaribacter sp. Z022]|uniref:O-antigen ligase family protein n=1 Tax=Polaribacter sp. Z022 TaxID=2927125 RepID=UPI002021E992|nr:O-antigen ligase family protein [Polaribacter sp. Z022]MCL7752803.1 O-antigen ligase family protein [Polaribacter sp. Z022]